MKLEFRELEADEIECRASMVRDNGLSLLLYKDARCDMKILDEAVGALNWQRHHTRDNANCIVSIWDEDKGQWIEKEDTGTESNTEKEKGLASDSFKRACFAWGIGRELYTAPFIWISAADAGISTANGKSTTRDKFRVKEIGYDDKVISKLVIENETKHKVVFQLGAKKPATPRTTTEDERLLKVFEEKFIACSEKQRAQIIGYYNAGTVEGLTTENKIDYARKCEEHK